MNETAKRVEQLGMARRLAGGAEVVGRGDQAPAEQVQPDPVDHHPGRQRVVARAEPGGQLAPTAAVGDRGGVLRAEHPDQPPVGSGRPDARARPGRRAGCRPARAGRPRPSRRSPRGAVGPVGRHPELEHGDPVPRLEPLGREVLLGREGVAGLDQLGQLGLEARQAIGRTAWAGPRGPWPRSGSSIRGDGFAFWMIPGRVP